jgi:Peptidase family M23
MIPIALAQTLIPLAAILWLWLGRPLSLPDMALRIVAAMALIFAVAQAGLWLAMPRAIVMVLAGLLVLAAIAAYRRYAASAVAPLANGMMTWAVRALTLAGAIVGIAVSAIAVIGQGPVSPTIDLAFPFEEGRYLVVSGGTTSLINPHVATLSTGHADWRGQSYAVDLVRIDRLGFRTHKSIPLTRPSDPAAYRIFGTTVIAPCSGSIDAVQDGLPDMAVPDRDRSALAGNHVRLRCAANIILLAHLRRGSIIVQPGQLVAKGAVIGQVGNSGQSDEPHLHIHAQRAPAAGAAPLSGAPVAIRFENRRPVRNTQFEISYIGGQPAT